MVLVVYVGLVVAWYRGPMPCSPEVVMIMISLERGESSLEEL